MDSKIPKICSLLGIPSFFLIIITIIQFVQFGTFDVLQSFVMVIILLRNLTFDFYESLAGCCSVLFGFLFAYELWYRYKHEKSYLEQDAYGLLSTAYDCEKDGGYYSRPVKIWKNSMSLFRGAEYKRYQNFWGRNVLSSFDMNITAQELKKLFISQSEKSLPEYGIMLMALKDENSERRISGARAALAKNPNCAIAYVLLAEEEAKTIPACGKFLERALNILKARLRNSDLNQCIELGNTGQLSRIDRDINVLMYAKRRLGMCYRKLGMLKEAVKMFREIGREAQSVLNVFPIQDNLIEALLEMKAYPDVQSYITKCPTTGVEIASATVLYTTALLKVRHVSERFVSEIGFVKRDLSGAEYSAIEAIHQAVCYNPHVPKYLLEFKPLIFPPEHYIKRGDTEAVSYAFFHLQHWKEVDGALQFLECTYEGRFASIPRPLNRVLNLYYPYPLLTRNIDATIFPAHHKLSVYPEVGISFFLVLTGGLCILTTVGAVLINLYPDQVFIMFKTLAARIY